LCAGFIHVVGHLAQEQRVFELLARRDDPRILARALVNQAISKARNLDKSSDAVRSLALQLCAAPRFACTLECLRILAVTKLRKTERKDVPAKRLKLALESQFRQWQRPSVAQFAKEAALSAPPWAIRNVASKWGDKKQLAVLLDGHWTAGSRSSLNVQSMERYLRIHSLRSKSA
jgi:hypothetical protein